MTTGPRVVLIRPWVDVHAGTACCSGQPRDALALDGRVGGSVETVAEAWRTAECYQLLRRELPEVDVQLVSLSNTAYLLPWAFRARVRHAGVREAVRASLRAPTAGAVLVDGEVVGTVQQLGPAGVLAAVRAAVHAPLT